MSQAKYKVGDMVMITQTEESREAPGFFSHMRSHKPARIKGVTSGGFYVIEIENKREWTYKEEWFYLIGPPKSKEELISIKIDKLWKRSDFYTKHLTF